MIAAKKAKTAFKKAFSRNPARVFFSPGRVEILGNHTDHNHGLAIASCIDRGITAAVRKNDDGCIQIASVGFRPFTFYVDELKLVEAEKGSSLALAKGVCRAMKDRGYQIGGFQAALISDIQAGSGLSSSAAIECLIAKILDVLYNDGNMDPAEMAAIGKYAENEYFGKACGLLDQSAIAYGGVNLLDFDSPKGVEVRPLQYHLPLHCFLINTGSSHAGLDALYKAIPDGMFKVAKDMLGVDYLRDSSKEDFMKAMSVGNLAVKEGDKLMAQHFYDECERVEAGAKALETNDSLSFLQALRESQISMATYLHNTMVPGKYMQSPQQAVDLATPFLKEGAARMSGGGFAGSVLCYCYPTNAPAFYKAISSYYGVENVYEIAFLDHGPVEIE